MTEVYTGNETFDAVNLDNLPDKIGITGKDEESKQHVVNIINNMFRDEQVTTADLKALLNLKGIDNVNTWHIVHAFITFDKTPATVYEVYDRQIKTARPDQADLKSSSLGEKSPVNHTLREILGNVKDLSGIPYVVDGHLNYYLLNKGKVLSESGRIYRGRCF